MGRGQNHQRRALGLASAVAAVSGKVSAQAGIMALDHSYDSEWRRLRGVQFGDEAVLLVCARCEHGLRGIHGMEIPGPGNLLHGVDSDLSGGNGFCIERSAGDLDAIGTETE